ncbi:YeiH family protein [Aestuariispira insulae]|uniref:Putative integral membrane protein (TIGR00698 family) n=1 Tax=Aestuariispira insulae TaxID=1461337 RepID=A0A3D9HI82_9PROT|nr:YeiH family protein [Aestuariispira insulae]RED48666.1 putative integral membrane protein (TIGR00698 family) [Aestuariispira insulae]
MVALLERGRSFFNIYFPGLIACCTVALAAVFLEEHYDGPAMLYALLLGIAFNFLSESDRTTKGIEIASKSILRIGVGLLGLRISFDQIAGLGWGPAVLMLAAIAATILFGWGVARLTKSRGAFGVLTGGAVGICGASAALAISAVLPGHKDAERDTIYTIVTVTALSTVAMILYPMMAGWLGLSESDTGIFLGGTIHDVAQVVGAGYSVSENTGDVATVIKLMRVALLIPVVLVIALLFRGQVGEGAASRLPVPLFAIGFVCLMALNNMMDLPTQITGFFVDLSRWCIILAVAALGMKTSFKSLVASGSVPFLLILGETVFLAVFVLGGMLLLG